MNYFLKNYYGYCILFISLFFFSILSILNKKRENQYIYIFSIISSFLIIFRFDFDFDFVWYWIVGDNRFKNYWVYNFEYERIEILFKVLYKLTRFLENPKLFFVLTGIIFCYLFFNSIKKYTEKKILALSLYFYLPSLYFAFLVGFIRQGIAIVTSFFLIQLLLKKKFLRYFLGILFITFFIHKSAIICLFHLILYKIKNKKILTVIKIIIILFFLNIESFLKNISFFKKYIFYLQTKIEFNLGLKIIVIVIFLYFLLEILRKIKRIKLTEVEKYYCELINVGILIFLLTSITIGGHIPMRIGLYFLIVFPIYFSKILNKMKIKKQTEIIIIVMLFLFANFNLIRVSYNEYFEVRKSWYFKLSFFNDYNDIVGKYTPHGKVEFNEE